MDAFDGMTLLQFARGPVMAFASFVFVAGILWRLVGIALLRHRRPLSPARKPHAWTGIRLIIFRSLPKPAFFRGGTAYGEVIGYIFHIGFFVALFFYLPHILFFRDVFSGLFGINMKSTGGFAWPALPGGVIYFFCAVSVAAMLGSAVHRFVNGPKRVLSNFDDYVSWLVTFLPLATGMLAYSHVGGPYQTLLGLHILSVALLLIWFPFGKLMHFFYFFTTRGAEGVQFERKGASL